MQIAEFPHGLSFFLHAYENASTGREDRVGKAACVIKITVCDIHHIESFKTEELFREGRTRRLGATWGHTCKHSPFRSFFAVWGEGYGQALSRVVHARQSVLAEPPAVFHALETQVRSRLWYKL